MNTWSWQGRLQLSLSLSTLFHWDRSSCWSGSLLFGLSWLPRKSCGLLVSAFQHLGTPGFSCGFWGFKLRSLGLPSKCFYPLSHFPRSYWQLFLKIKLKPSWTTVVWRDGMSFCHFFFFIVLPPSLAYSPHGTFVPAGLVPSVSIAGSIYSFLGGEGSPDTAGSWA